MKKCKEGNLTKFWNKYLGHILSALIISLVLWACSLIGDLIRNAPKQTAGIERLEKDFREHRKENRQYFKNYNKMQKEINQRLADLEKLHAPATKTFFPLDVDGKGE